MRNDGHQLYHIRYEIEYRKVSNDSRLTRIDCISGGSLKNLFLPVRNCDMVFRSDGQLSKKWLISASRMFPLVPPFNWALSFPHKSNICLRDPFLSQHASLKTVCRREKKPSRDSSKCPDFDLDIESTSMKLITTYTK